MRYTSTTIFWKFLIRNFFSIWFAAQNSTISGFSGKFPSKMSLLFVPTSNFKNFWWNSKCSSKQTEHNFKNLLFFVCSIEKIVVDIRTESDEKLSVHDTCN